jgi:hypothetical protein
MIPPRAFLLVVGISLVSPVQAPALTPEAEARIDTARATLGDPILLQLHLRHRSNERPVLPQLAGLMQDIAVQEKGKIGPRHLDEGGVETILEYELRPYALGRREIPSLPVRFIRASGDTLLRKTLPLKLEVLSVRQEGEEGLRDIKPPLEIPGGIPLWLAGMLAALVVVAFVVGLLWVLDRRKKQPETQPPAPLVDYAAEFVRIAGMGLLERGEIKTYYSLLSDNLRRYLEKSLGIDALEQTTSEITWSLRQAGTKGSIIQEVANFLVAADLVKFARFVPELENARRAPAAGMAIVRTVEAIKAEREEQERAAAQSVT